MSTGYVDGLGLLGIKPFPELIFSKITHKLLHYEGAMDW